LSPLPILICLDEFPVFLSRILERNCGEGEKFLGWLRAWRQQGTACRFIFSGSVGIRSLLNRYRLTTSVNDCFDFPLGPFIHTDALEMLQEVAGRENLKADDSVLEYLCERTGWLSPYFLNLLLDETLRVARERIAGLRLTDGSIQTEDVDSAYQRRIDKDFTLFHWYQRLERDLAEPDLGMAKAVLRHVAKAKNGLTRKQIMNRLASLEPDDQARSDRMNYRLISLHEEGYLSQEEPIRFLSPILRDYWEKNHAN